MLSIYSQHASLSILSMHHLQATKVILVDCAAKGIRSSAQGWPVRTLALEDLRRTRRNMHLVDVEDHAEIVAEFRAAQRGEAGGKLNHAGGGAHAA